jgi:hypothetical protein
MNYAFVSLCAIWFALPAALMALEKPVYEERFTKQSKLVYFHGAKLGDQGSGCSGKSDDFAYTAVDLKPETKLMAAAMVIPHGLPAEMKKATVALWYRAKETPRGRPTSLIKIGGFNLLWQEDNNNPALGCWNMRIENGKPGDSPMRGWYNPFSMGTAASWDATDEWIFYALTWDPSQESVIVYQGSAKRPISEEKRWQRKEAMSPLPNGDRPGIIGNSLKNNDPADRAFIGSIDNVRIFESVLTEKELEQLRSDDLANRP